jgi:hypothetical protein
MRKSLRNASAFESSKCTMSRTCLVEDGFLPAAASIAAQLFDISSFGCHGSHGELRAALHLNFPALTCQD